MLFWCSDYLPFVANLLYNLAPPLASSSGKFSARWDAVSHAWGLKNSHQIKYNSQLLGCDHFFKLIWHPFSWEFRVDYMCVWMCVCARAHTASHMYAALQHISGHYTHISYSTRFHLATWISHGHNPHGFQSPWLLLRPYGNSPLRQAKTELCVLS